MKRIIFVVLMFVSACDDSQTPAPPPNPPPPAKKCRNVRVDKGPITISVWTDPERKLENDFILQSLNQYWASVGVKMVLASSPEKANIGLLYFRGSCREPVMAGRIQLSYWAKLDSIVLDESCIERADFARKFPAAASHALGNLMGIEASPTFCGAGIMKKSVLMMTDEPPAGLTEDDRQGFFHRSEYSSRWEEVEECLPLPEAGKFQPTDFRTVRFSADAQFQNIGVQNILNDYFALFGRSFELTANKTEAEFKMAPWTLTKGGSCSPLAIAMADRREIQVRAECLTNNVEAYWAETILVHETAHLFGMNHIPRWCASSVMSPYVMALPQFTSADVLEWQNRDKSESVLDSHRVLRMRYKGKDVDFVPIARLRLERLLRTM